jgi:glutathione peroxidase
MKLMFMKVPYFLIALASCFGYKADIKTKPEGVKPTVSFYNLQAVSLDGDTINFSKYKGKKVLIVNTASECGYTPQYEDLQKLSEQYGDKLVVLGFPCNQFGKQEPGNNNEIQQFCKKNYGVTFQMFDKVEVKGEGVHPVYRWLTDKSLNGWNNQAPTWNFCKYLINEDGELIKYFSSGISPTSSKITGLL